MNDSRFRLPKAALCATLALGVLFTTSPAQNTTTAPQNSTANTTNAHPDPWWKHAVIYEIYPRSFQDTNGDGIGDINGIASRLNYIQQLGVDAIWITPMYPSPQIDFGYDISDYTAIDPQYGSMADFDHLMSEAKSHKIKVLMDYVPNHTSDQHSWFKESRSSRTNPKRNWYIWRNPKGYNADGTPIPPNNWQSWFGHSAWQWDPTTKQFYYHHFYVQQPDLNWRNPEVQKAMLDVLRFWLDKGISGFRIDAVSRLFEDPKLHDDPYLPGINAYGDRNIRHQYTDNLPEVHDMLRKMRAVADQYPGNPVLISEADEPNIAELTKMYGLHNDEIQLPMDFQVADINVLSAPRFRELLQQIEANSAHGQPYFFFGNHDQDRIWDRYSHGVTDPEYKARIVRILSTLLLTTRATPQLYYGDEIGMVTTPPARIEDVKDPIGKLGWPQEKGRDGERTPMQWNSGLDAGFSTAQATWLPIAPNYKTVNVEAETPESSSLLNWHKQLIEMRRSNPTMRDGKEVMLNTDNPSVLCYARPSVAGSPSILVALNFTDQPQTLTLDPHPAGISGSSIKTLLTDAPALEVNSTLTLTLPPYTTWIGEAK